VACETCGSATILRKFEYIVDFDEKPATLRCRGDEDRTTQGRRRRALTRAIRAQTDVIVDLTELVFADVSLMLDLAMLARRLRAHGRAILLRGAQPQVKTLIEFVYREARLIDEKRFDEWYDLYADDGRYWMPLMRSQPQGASRCRMS